MQLYTAIINGVAYRPSSDSLTGCVREVARELSVYDIKLSDLETEQTSPTTWNVIHEGIVARVEVE